MQSNEFIKLAKENIIKDFYKDDMFISENDVLLVWFCKTIQNWKAIFTTIYSDGKIFEVTYNGDEEEMYIDEYVKTCKKTYGGNDNDNLKDYFINQLIKEELTNTNKELKEEKQCDTLWQY